MALTAAKTGIDTGRIRLLTIRRRWKARQVCWHAGQGIRECDMIRTCPGLTGQ